MSFSGAPAARLPGIRDFLTASLVHDIDLAVAERFGDLRASLLDGGRVVGELDLLNASVALVHNLTLVTHNTKDYASIPGLTVEDWLVP